MRNTEQTQTGGIGRRPHASKKSEMVSIVMAVKDSLEFTKLGIQSILDNTESDFEIIVVDNGSGPDTVNYLNSLSDQRIKVIRNEANLGCSAAWNQGIKAASGDYVMVANNDIAVPKGWLTKLRECLIESGAAWVSPCMREGELDYDFNTFHDRFVNKFKNQLWEDNYRAVALFSERALYTEAIGWFDERYKFGTYEDEDFFWRLKQAGLRSVVTGSVLIHHYGSRTISVEKRRTPKFKKENRKKFHKKWREIYLRRKLLNISRKREMKRFEAIHGHRY